MRISGRLLALPLLVIVVSAPLACGSMPKRRSAPPERARPTAQLDMHLIDRLGERWSVDYVQVYLDGWLVWQGAPERGGGFLGSRDLRGSGEQELDVRVVATRDGGHGGLTSERQMVTIRPGSQRVRIYVKGHPFKYRSFSVSVDTR